MVHWCIEKQVFEKIGSVRVVTPFIRDYSPSYPFIRPFIGVETLLVNPASSFFCRCFSLVIFWAHPGLQYANLGCLLRDDRKKCLYRGAKV